MKKIVLCKGLSFAIPPKTTEYSEFLVPFEVLFRDINSSEVSNLNKECVKSRLRDSAYTSFKQVSKISETNLSKEDKGNNIVILNRSDYVSKLNKMLEDASKFKSVNIKKGKALNHLIHMEERIIRLLKSLEGQGEISEKEKNDLYPSGSKPEVLHGLAKIHKALEDGTPSFRPILSAIRTPTYNLAKFCDQLLKPLTSNDYTIKDSFSFVKDVLDFDASCFMASFDIKSLFTNIPLTETLNLCVQNLYRNQTLVNNFTKRSFYKLLKITMFESFFIFDGKFYEQCDGVAMGSPLGPALANVFMCHFENIWLENCPSHFKPIVYRRFVDDAFLLFRSKDHV